MKKTLLYAILLIAFTMNVNAQFDVLIDEDFNGTTMPTNWNTYNLGDTACDAENWTFGSGVVPAVGTDNDFSTNAAIFDDDSYDGDGNHNKSALFYGADPATNTLNPLDLTSYNGAIILAYDYTLYQYNNEVLQVGVWDISNAQWVIAKTYDSTTEDDAGNPTILHDYVNLRDILDNNPGIDQAAVYLGFIYDDINGSWGYGAGVDNVLLEAYTNPQPGNDDCENADDITDFMFTGSMSSLEDATGATNNNGFIPTLYDGYDDGMNDGVWYSFTALYDGQVTIEVLPDNNFDAQIGVFTGDCSNLTCIATVDDGLDYGETETLTIDVNADEDYLINIGSYEGSFNESEGMFTLNVSFGCSTTPPANDLIDNAIEMTSDTFSDTVNVACAAFPPAGTYDCDILSVKHVYYKFYADAPSTVTATVVNPTSIKGAVFFEAPSLNATDNQLVRVDQPDNPCFPADSYSIDTEAGKYYYVVVSNGHTDTEVTINGVQTVGISNQTIEGVNLYPNPVNDILSITSPNNIDDINVYNIAGQLVFHTTPDMLNTQINTADWAKGTYMVKVSVGNQTGVYHIVKK